MLLYLPTWLVAMAACYDPSFPLGISALLAGAVLSFTMLKFCLLHMQYRQYRLLIADSSYLYSSFYSLNKCKCVYYF